MNEEEIFEQMQSMADTEMKKMMRPSPGAVIIAIMLSVFILAASSIFTIENIYHLIHCTEKVNAVIISGEKLDDGMDERARYVYGFSDAHGRYHSATGKKGPESGDRGIDAIGEDVTLYYDPETGIKWPDADVIGDRWHPAAEVILVYGVALYLISLGWKTFIF